jgi:hypothetical protein
VQTSSKPDQFLSRVAHVLGSCRWASNWPAALSFDPAGAGAQNRLCPNWAHRSLRCRFVRRAILATSLNCLTVEEKRPWWGVRTSNPGGAVSRSLVGSTPTLFRHASPALTRPRVSSLREGGSFMLCLQMDLAGLRKTGPRPAPVAQRQGQGSSSAAPANASANSFDQQPQSSTLSRRCH